MTREEIEERIDDLQSDIDGIDEQIEELEIERHDLQREIDSLKKQLSEMEK